LDQLLQAGNDCRYERGRILTRRPKKLFVAGHREPVSTVRDASDNETWHTKLAAGLNDGRPFHFDRGGTKSVTQCASTGYIREKHIASNDDALDDPW
jgi:hypothetical protein